MNRKIPSIIAAGVIVGILVAFGGWVYFGATVVRQTRHMKVTRTYLPAITNAVYSHPEFRGISVGVYTGIDDCFAVSGVVDTDKQLSELEGIIASAKPPSTTVKYLVKVLERYRDAKP